MIHWGWLILAVIIMSIISSYLGYKDDYEHGKMDMINNWEKF